ncbi:50S ribosomal protein L31 [Candidatus Nomurabacteria bacterium]|uniref:50S ribosomal protein L31 n=1 Tax=Candidatus Dojkabacteria bacterium TaxID=2099670 RepID=A0A955KXY3_9BACT|nr:50S ribosomal protein L31 [Candidatus Dojkabacteria bacterium]MCB9789818.1 50S ribosomal protein L31 [Candidatus Nomurabacteria bacterium]MCB9803558.1 50S ribosomal protein L31 [Candidatus Nomurabacteria bacterium]
MKKDIHPKYNHNVKVTCSCGNTFVTGSILDEITTELCSKCHPFFTGEQKIVDTDNLVAKFEEKRSKAQDSFRSKRQKMQERKNKLQKLDEKSSASAGLTLRDMLENIGK